VGSRRGGKKNEKNGGRGSHGCIMLGRSMVQRQRGELWKKKNVVEKQKERDTHGREKKVGVCFGKSDKFCLGIPETKLFKAPQKKKKREKSGK